MLNLYTPKKQKPPTFKLGNIWGHMQPSYTLLKFKGEGSYGQVVQARHISSGQEVAIKLVENIFKNHYETKKVLREIKLLRLLSDMGCKHVVKLIDLVLVKDSLFIVMEYMPLDLKKALNQSIKV